MAEPILLPGAATDYQEGYSWYLERGLSLAEGFEREVDQALQLIGQVPRQFARYDDRHHCLLLRRFPYVIIYRIDQTHVVIVAVAHTKRRPGYWTGRAE